MATRGRGVSPESEHETWNVILDRGFKGALCSCGEEIQTQYVYIHNNNEVLIQTVL